MTRGNAIPVEVGIAICIYYNNEFTIRLFLFVIIDYDEFFKSVYL